MVEDFGASEGRQLSRFLDRRFSTATGRRRASGAKSMLLDSTERDDKSRYSENLCVKKF